MADYEKVMHKLDYLDDTKGLIKDAIIEKGQDITDDVTFREYVQKIKEISSGDVKLFNTYEEMYAYEKAKEGDLAIIYNREFEDIYANKSFSAVLIQRVITIGSTSNISRIFYVSNNLGCQMQVYISPFNEEALENNYLRITMNNSKQSINLKYTANETGLVFTFDSGTISLGDTTTDFIFDTETFVFDFESALTINSSYNNVFNGVFKIRVVDFQGLFQYTTNNINDTKMYSINNIHLVDTDFVADTSDIVNFKEFYDKEKLIESTDEPPYGLFIVNDIENGLPKTAVNYGNTRNLIYYNNKFYFAMYDAYSTLEQAEEVAETLTEVVTTYNLEDNTYTRVNNNYSVIEVVGTESTRYYIIGSELDVSKNVISFWKYSSDIYTDYLNISIPISDSALLSTHSIFFEPVYEDGWILAPNQFTALDNSHLVTNKSAYGRNGIITGDGTYLRHVTTSEYKNYFAPQLPTEKQKLYTEVILSGKSVPYYSFVKRVERNFDDVSPIPSDNALTVLLNTLSDGSITNDTYNRAYNCQSHRTFYVEKDNRLYFGYFGYNRTERESPGNPGKYIHETITAIHGVLVDLISNEVIREVNYTTAWIPFDGWGNDREDPEADISYLNYDVIHDEFIMVVTTGTWAWSNEQAPYLAVMSIKGTTGVATPTRYQIGRNGATRTYTQVYDVRYDITTKNLIIPIKSWNANESTIVDRIVKLEPNGTKTLWVDMSGTQLSGLDRMGDEESFYTKVPVYYYYYTQNNTTHHILKRIDNNTSVEIPAPYSMMKDRRVMYNNYFYYTSTTTSGNGYAMIRVNLNAMTYEEYGTFKSYYNQFILLDRVPYVYYNNYLYSLNDLDEPAYMFYNTPIMYNDVRVDGITVEDGYINGMYPKATINSTEISLTRVSQILYEYSFVDSFPVDGDLMMTWPPIDNAHTMGTLRMHDSIWLSTKNYDGTINPFDYQRALRTARQIEGRVY